MENESHTFRPRPELLDALDDPGKLFIYNADCYAFTSDLKDYAVAYGSKSIVSFLTDVWKQEHKLIKTCVPGSNGRVMIVMHEQVAKRDYHKLLDNFGKVLRRVIYKLYLPSDLKLVQDRWKYTKCTERVIDLELHRFNTISQTDINDLLRDANGRPGVEAVKLVGNASDCITTSFYQPINPAHQNLFVGMLTASIEMMLNNKHRELVTAK